MLPLWVRYYSSMLVLLLDRKHFVALPLAKPMGWQCWGPAGIIIIIIIIIMLALQSIKHNSIIKRPFATEGVFSLLRCQESSKSSELLESPIWNRSGTGSWNRRNRFSRNRKRNQNRFPDILSLQLHWSTEKPIARGTTRTARTVPPSHWNWTEQNWGHPEMVRFSLFSTLDSEQLVG